MQGKFFQRPFQQMFFDWISLSGSKMPNLSSIGAVCGLEGGLVRVSITIDLSSVSGITINFSVLEYKVIGISTQSRCF